MRNLLLNIVPFSTSITEKEFAIYTAKQDGYYLMQQMTKLHHIQKTY
ncbi:MAG: hypothetical protein IPP29_08990 [Bacteroidetes bacterium]|nr:hypothetical protein [Bacteroidota bacterium]